MQLARDRNILLTAGRDVATEAPVLKVCYFHSFERVVVILTRCGTWKKWIQMEHQHLLTNGILKSKDYPWPPHP